MAQAWQWWKARGPARIRKHGAAGLLLALISAPAAGAVCDAPLRAVTYNIRLDTPADGDNRWALRRGALLDQLALIRPDLLGLQEVLPGQRRDISAALPGHHALGGGRDDGADQGEASPLLAARQRLRLVAGGMFWLSPTPGQPSTGWDAAYRRVASWARLVDRCGGRRLLVVNTHWDHVGRQARLESARQIAGWLAAMRRKDEAVLVMGDFNAPLDEASLAELMRAAALRDARGAARAAPVGPATTFNGFAAVLAESPAIDHVLVGHGLCVARYQVLAQHHGGRVPSDHFPVIADLAFCR